MELARAEVEDSEYDVNKLSLAQILQSRNIHIQQRRVEIDCKENRDLREQNDALKEQNDAKDAQIVSLEEQVLSFRAENEASLQGFFCV